MISLVPPSFCSVLNLPDHLKQLASAPFDLPGSWSIQSNSTIGGSDYGNYDVSALSAVKDEACAPRRHHCDWTVVGPVAANGSRLDLIRLLKLARSDRMFLTREAQMPLCFVTGALDQIDQKANV
eukprot:344807-Hanusia_phi.AAC.24